MLQFLSIIQHTPKNEHSFVSFWLYTLCYTLVTEFYAGLTRCIREQNIQVIGAWLWPYANHSLVVCIGFHMCTYVGIYISVGHVGNKRDSFFSWHMLN